MVGCNVVSGRPLRHYSPPPHANSFVLGPAVIKHTQITQSPCGGGVAARSRRPGARSGLPCPVLASGRRCCLAGAGLGSHCGVEFGRSKTLYYIVLYVTEGRLPRTGHCDLVDALRQDWPEVNDVSIMLNLPWPEGCERSDGCAWALVLVGETVTKQELVCTPELGVPACYTYTRCDHA